MPINMTWTIYIFTTFTDPEMLKLSHALNLNPSDFQKDFLNY